MKRTLVFFLVLLFVASCWAAGTAPRVKIKTGDASLDMALHDIDKRAATKDGVKLVVSEMGLYFSLGENQISVLRRKGFSWSEIYYMALISKQSGKNINDIAALRSQGLGWGVVAKRIGVHPSELNKLRVRLKKEQKEKQRIKTKAKNTSQNQLQIEINNNNKGNNKSKSNNKKKK
jgi:hypothetical protein